MRRAVTHGCHIREGATRAQLNQLIPRLQLCAEIAPFSRCTRCNEPLERVDPASVRCQVPAAVARHHQAFWRCLGCGWLYWKGSHWAAMRRQIAALCPGVLPGSQRS
jgi:uncharacterized protein with PIN domain